MKRITTKDELNTLTSQNKLVVLKFGATWCAPCQQVVPVLEAASQRHPNIVFVEVDVDAGQDLAVQMQVQQVPTTLFIKHDKIVDILCGPMTEGMLEEVISRNL